VKGVQIMNTKNATQKIVIAALLAALIMKSKELCEVN